MLYTYDLHAIYTNAGELSITLLAGADLAHYTKKF